MSALERLEKLKEDTTAFASRIKVHEQSASVCYRVHESCAKIAEHMRCKPFQNISVCGLLFNLTMH